MDSITELAKMFKERDNPEGYSPMFGTVIKLPELDIWCGGKLHIGKERIDALFDIYEEVYDDSHRSYKYLNKKVVMLPYKNNQRFIVLGAVN